MSRARIDSLGGRWSAVLRTGLLLFAAASTLGCRAPAASSPTADREPGLTDAIVDRWLRDEPSWGRQVGLHGYDGLVGHYEAAAIAEHARWLHHALASLAEARPEASPDGAVAEEALDRAILAARIRLALFNLEQRAEWRTDPRFYEDLFDVSSYVDFDYAPLPLRALRLVEHEERALGEVPNIEKNLAAELSRPVLQTAINAFIGHAEYLRTDVKKLIETVKDDALQARFSRANDALAQAADQIARDLQERWLPRANDHAHVLGKARYLAFVAAQEGLHVELGEFSRMAEEDLARNKAAYEALLATTPVSRPPAERLLSEAARIMGDARRFVIDKKLCTIPSDERADVEVSPPFMRWNAAFLNMPGPFDSVAHGHYYLTLPDPKWPPKEQQEYVFPLGTLLSTTVHEVVPGHFLQGLWARRAPTRVQKMADSYSFVEGWAHYGEQLMIEQGFGAADPQNRLGQLGDALLRDCRFAVSIGVHTAGMTLDEAERRFREDCHQDRASAREQAVRATFDPGYFAYTLGKLQILELRAEAQRRLGARFDLRAFHDALLSHGAPPIALIRERVLRQLGAGR